MKRPAGATRGNCYVAAEALYHLLGGKRAGLQVWRQAATFGTQPDTHWYLVLVPYKYAARSVWTVIDPTRRQFSRQDRKRMTRDWYLSGTRTGFLTKRPSRRAQQLMERVVWQP